MDVQFVTSIAPIVRDAEASRSFYADALGLDFEGRDGDYVFTHELEGTKHFGLWPLSEAANACFGTTEWPADTPTTLATFTGPNSRSIPESVMPPGEALTGHCHVDLSCQSVLRHQ